MKNMNMLEGPILKNIFIYTIPIILTGVIQLLFNAADLAVVGRYCGEISVAAVGNATIVTYFLVNLFAGFSVGAGVTAAQAIGAKDEDTLHQTVHTAMPLSVICGVIATIFGIAFSEKLLILMNTPDSVLPLSDIYIKVYFAGAIFMLIYNFGAAILRAAGDTKTPLMFLLISGGINVILNLIFVTLFDMNVVGVALATTISQAISAVLVVMLLMRRTDGCKLILSKIRIYKPQLQKIIRIGVPAGLQNALFSISNIVIQSAVNTFGDVFMSGNAVAGNIEGFIYVSLNSFMQTALNFVGQNVGAKQYKRVKKILFTCMASVFAVGIVMTTLVNLFGTTLLSIYIVDSEEAIKYGLIRLLFVGYAYCLGGVVDVVSGSLRGMGASVLPMIISVFGVCGVRILWIYTIFQMPKFHTPQCLYSSYGISYIVTLAVLLVIFLIIFKRQSSLKQYNI